MVDWFRRIATVVVALPLACTALHYDITSVLLAVIVSCGCFYEYCKGLMPPILSSLLPLKKDDTGDLKYPSRHNVTLLLAVCLASSFGVESLMRVHNVNIVGLTLFLVIFTRLLIALYDFQEGTGLHNEVYSPRVLRFKHSLFAMADNKQAVALGAILHVFGLLAIVWTFCHAVYLRTVHPGPGLQIFGMLCAYGSDNGGLFFGKTFKGPKLAPVLSPHKTWSGFIGSMLLCSGTAVLLAHFKDNDSMRFVVGTLPASLTLAKAVVLGMVMAFTATVGDLIESLIKRTARVKDAGNFFPGHGGWLDRVDSLLFTLPALYFLFSSPLLM